MMQDSVYPEFVEVDPSGRYGRYNEILGKGASKAVYRAFDEYEGMEVAWNQVKLYDFLQSPDDLERLYCEIHLLKTLKHKNIMKFYASWVDISKRNINFVTEMFTSGTLRQYRQMHKRVHIRAVKHWCRQILIGLLYLHSNDPPIIHRDLKCDNIFINGNQGEVKIGDLGLAAILRKSHAVHCVGTPEFMAPEVYEEEYNELVDIYSFGMCVLEMVTFEYPYSECTHPAQIYKKVISGAKPDALYRVKDPEVREFIKKCLAKASQRPSSRELLMDPFLQNDCIDMRPISRQPSYSSHINNECLISNGSSSDLQHESEMENDWENDSDNFEKHGIDLFSSDEDKDEDEPMKNMDITIKGRKGDDGGIFIRLRIGDTEGRARNIYFPFDIDADTALGVAAEMVDELDITDHEVTRIAEMIDGEVLSLVPKWESQLDLQHSSNLSNEYFCEQANDEAETFQKENESENLNNYEKKTPQDTKWLKLIYQVKVKEFRKRVLGRRTMNFSLDLDSEKLVCDEVKSSKFVKQMKSFHLGTRFSFRRPEIDREEDRSLMNNDHIALANIFEEKGYIAGDSFPNSLPRARSLCI